MTSKEETMPGAPVTYDNTPAPPYTQPQVQTTMIIRDTQPMPNNNMIFACVVLWLCPASLICGLVAFICSMRVKSLYDGGDYEGAVAAANQAKIWSIVGLVLGVIDIVISVVIVFIMVVVVAGTVGAAVSLADDLNDLNNFNYDFNNYQVSFFGSNFFG
ncbi:uncharacterized protein [Apostichopus japonicus]|uniref:uncharacterized protein n=1 Tax=Stichopus japonicus TaxID=307972 RepID=UPI003AB328A6